MKQDPFSGYRALSPKELAEMLMNPNAPKTEAEHWAVREIEKQRAEIERLRAEVDLELAWRDAYLQAQIESWRPPSQGLTRAEKIDLALVLAALAGGGLFLAWIAYGALS